MGVEVLNPHAARTELEPVALSQQILGEAKALESAELCARLDALAAELHGVGPGGIDGDAARIAFWVNLYNALLLHRLCLHPLRGSVLRHLRLFDRVAYTVGGEAYTLNVIEHGLLRANRRPILRLGAVLRPNDPRRAAAPARPDPRIHFALNCGARSCPPVRSYDPAELDAQLELATRSYLQSETRVDAERGRVTLPRLMRIYARDFGNRRERLEFAAERLPPVAELVRSAGPVRVRYGHFDWTVAQAARV